MRLVLPAAAVLGAVALFGSGLAASSPDRSACGRLGDRQRTASPDGGRLALVRCTPDGSAWVYVADARGERRLVPADYGCCYRPSSAVVFRDPAWSPDGRRLAVVIEDAGGTDVWVIHVATASARRVTAGPARESDPRWSADGRRITFRTETGGVGSATGHEPSPPGPDEARRPPGVGA